MLSGVNTMLDVIPSAVSSQLKALPKENLFIKTSPNFTGWNNWLFRAFLPHSPEEVQQFYKPYIGRP